MKLQPFAEANPPQDDNMPAPQDLVDRFVGLLPDCLIELWRVHGLGTYGPRQLCLIDPTDWQAALDRWIVSPEDEVQRTPIALTPFGKIVFHRKLTETDEDVAVLDPVERSMEVLTWDLAEFFNDFMADPESADTLTSMEMLYHARRQHGALEPGEVYETDPVLLPAQVLRFSRQNGLQMHKRLRDLVDSPQETNDDPPATIAELLPAAFRDDFPTDGGLGEPATAFYFSSYVDRHRLLALEPDGAYRLLFWMTDAGALYPAEPRLYSGAYGMTETESGDTVIRLEMNELADSTGRDFDDRDLIVMRSGDMRHLLQCLSLKHIAADIGRNGMIDEPDAVFAQVRLSDGVTPHPEGGWPAPPFSDLPAALKELVHRRPLIATITDVDPFVDDGDEDATVMVTIDLGTDDGLSMNMPFYSPAKSGKALRGWVWRLDAKRCHVGIDPERDEDGRIVEMPEVGDVLTSRDPSADGPE